jgi:hypothetical protein
MVGSEEKICGFFSTYATSSNFVTDQNGPSALLAHQ